MNNCIDQLIRVAMYLRLSREDGDLSFSDNGKNESNSINNQREIIRQFIEKHPEMELCGEYKDDGKTGTNFDRPGFKDMMNDVKAGKIDCIIVKDLSRFGRDYIRCGDYIQVIFPELGIRFISISEGYDSADPNSSNELLFPITNIMNDNYARDISRKVRMSMTPRRQKGDYVSNYVAYGYERDPEDKNKLVVDKYAGAVVRDIFMWFIEGYSPTSIANKLNELGILSPLEYKRSLGYNYASNFKKKNTSTWSHVSVRRMLRDEIYIGVTIQGKREKPNYKSKLTRTKKESDWFRVEGTHTPIIEKRDFDLVQRLLQEDVRASAQNTTVQPLSGRLFCADCGAPMIRKTVTSKGKTYVYYICGSNKVNKEECSRHKINEEFLLETVLVAIQKEIEVLLNIDQALSQVEQLAWEKSELSKINANIEAQKELIRKNSELRNGIYEDLQEQIISKEEFVSLRNEFSTRIATAQKALQELESQREIVFQGLCKQQGLLARFRNYANVTELSRTLVVNMIDKISIHENQEISILFTHKDELKSALEFLERVRKYQNSKIIVLPKLEVV